MLWKSTAAHVPWRMSIIFGEEEESTGTNSQYAGAVWGSVQRGTWGVPWCPTSSKAALRCPGVITSWPSACMEAPEEQSPPLPSACSSLLCQGNSTTSSSLPHGQVRPHPYTPLHTSHKQVLRAPQTNSTSSQPPDPTQGSATAFCKLNFLIPDFLSYCYPCAKPCVSTLRLKNT